MEDNGNVGDNSVYTPRHQKFGLSGGGSIGCYITDNIRLEIEGSIGIFNAEKNKTLQIRDVNNSDQLVSQKDSNYFWMITDKQDIDTNTLLTNTGIQYQYDGFKYISGMVNVYFEIPTSVASLYFGGGGGMSQFTFKSNEEIKNNLLTFQGKAGVILELSPLLRPYIGYKLIYFTPKEIEITSNIISDFANHKDPIAKAIDNDIKVQMKPNYILHIAEVGVMLNF